MAHYDYIEKAVKVSRREFIGLAGVAGAILWTGAYVATDLVQDRNKYIKLRAQGIYKDDEKAKIRQSHNNQALSDVYTKFAQNPLSHLSEDLFHTKYIDRTKLV
ncbi:putative periplasmic (Fe) hydrogenase small subunit [uncultured Sporomusa sp.]|uniref:Putative periplasmic (Fe) hydrogenase small subunit n=1 Tax=uncultured Sporomusa sp. TaxID=307249 RepID=A0A212LWL5_9FIRM|nr:iron hydrogenase small subunit [uncultured Sporomusa sp.]SCM81901.1 putative periplasmic (Fe) hydrogenase small subunit [uncultured Sporomusa sp.]